MNTKFIFLSFAKFLAQFAITGVWISLVTYALLNSFENKIVFCVCFGYFESAFISPFIFLSWLAYEGWRKDIFLI
jgi:hypothetical protein